ncbi:bifunctional serine/threonine-protein kinase/formylglycine-generating enzyme family protein [Lysobacter korlensis]|uniref:Bifunctional serine/threonine-protein kinase/formylglycine-generating enzyme family protein n=1 Tax=Lysobacter korlensis TaxID=553636 RepID=A0ABV6RPR5_9GAMM
MPVHVNSDDASTQLPEIQGYRLLRLINHGGMSTVYLGEQLALSREVAIKVMMPQALADEVSRRRFENEVRTIARLEHPNVVRIHELGRTRDGLPFYTMPYLSRGHLGQRKFVDEQGIPDEAKVRETAHALFAALEYAHSRGVVHRDVKAENVLFDEAERPLLADFGIALRRGFGPRVTAAGMAVGSTAYMAPEQARGEEVDGRADLYSLGVVIWEMLTGQLPFRAADALSMAVMHAQDPIPKLPPHLRHWQRFMNRALAKNPDQRFQDVTQMRGAMDAIRPRRQFPQLMRVTAALRKKRVARALAVAAVASAIAVTVGTSVGLFDRSSDGEFFRADTQPASPAVSPAVTVRADPTEAMLEPLPEAPLQRTLERARAQLEQRKLTAPEGDNAYATALEAWHADSTNPEVQQVIAAVTDAIAEELVRNLGEGNDTRARDYYMRAQNLARQTGGTGAGALTRLQERTTQTLQARMEDAVERFDRKAAQRTARVAKDFGLPAAVTRRFTAQAEEIPRQGQTMPGDPARGVFREGEDGAIVIGRRPVDRGDYGRFVEATRRASSLCRERVSPLRMLAPRDWKSPGFEQGASDPVVCVSMADAEAYARWYSAQTGHRYRVPTASEARQVASDISGRNVSLWLRDCGRTCVQRQVGGPSWRSKQLMRPLDADRGYDDVGFRLVREL